MQQNTDEVADDLPRVLLENYLLLAAAIETQNLGRLPDMLQYSQKVHQNLLEVMQQIEDAPTLAMTAGPAAPAAGAGAETSAPPAVSGSDTDRGHECVTMDADEPVDGALPAAAAAATSAAPPEQQQQLTWANGPSWLQHVNVSVEQLLRSIGLSQYVPVLEQQQVDMAALQLMEERHLRELGLPLGAVVKIKAALAAQLQTH